MQIAEDLNEVRWTMVQQNLSSIPLPFLALVTPWLTALFVSFGLVRARDLSSEPMQHALETIGH